MEDGKGIKTILGLTVHSKKIVEETKHHLKELYKRKKIENTRSVENFQHFSSPEREKIHSSTYSAVISCYHHIIINHAYKDSSAENQQ